MKEQMSAEAVVLHRVIEGNEVSALELLADFFPSELTSLAEHACRLAELAEQACREKSAR